jgi:hypothetical protein
MRVILVKDETNVNESDTKRKCALCKEDFRTQLRVERGTESKYALGGGGSVFHLKCIKKYIEDNVLQHKKALENLETDLNILNKYKDDMIIEELAK